MESSQIDILYGSDGNRSLEARIRALALEDPWTQNQFQDDPESQHDPIKRVCAIHISRFFDNGTNLIYYIRGTRNFGMFLVGMNGMQAFNGPLLFAVSASTLSCALESVKFTGSHRIERQIKTDSPLSRNKWRYLYETGRLAWDKTDVDMDKLNELLCSDAEDSETMRLDEDNTGVDSEDGQHELGSSTPGPQPGPQSAQAVISIKRKGKMKAVQNEAPPSGSEVKDTIKEVEQSRHSGMFDMKLGGSTPKDDTKPSKCSQGSKGARGAETLTQDQMQLEAYMNLHRVDSVDALWARLTQCTRSDNFKRIEHDAITTELVKEIEVLLKREEGFVHKKSTVSSTSGSSRIAAELDGLKCQVAVDRHRLIQRLANESAKEQKRLYQRIFLSTVDSLIHGSMKKREIKNCLMDQLMYEGRDRSLGVANALETEEVQIIMNLVENIELQKEYCEKIDDIDDGTWLSEDHTHFADIGDALDIECREHAADLATIAFKYNRNIQVRNALDVTDREEIITDARLVRKQELVEKVMEAIQQDGPTAVDLLHRSDWVPEAAITLWYDGNAMNLSNPLDTGAEVKASSPSPVSSTKRPHTADAGPSSSRKKQKTTDSDREQAISPEEDTDAARARFERAIKAESDSIELDRVEKAQNESESRAEAGRMPRGAPGYYSLERLKNLIAEGARLLEEKTTYSNQNEWMSGLEGPDSSTIPSANSERYDLRDRSKKIDYSAMERGAGRTLQENMVAAGGSRDTNHPDSAISNQIQKRQSTASPLNAQPLRTRFHMNTTSKLDGTSVQQLTPAVHAGSSRFTEALRLADSLLLPPSSDISPIAISTSYGNDQPAEQDSNVDCQARTPVITPQIIDQLVEKYTKMRKQRFSQTFVPASLPPTQGSGLLGPGEGMSTALKYLQSGALTLGPQYMPSIDQSRSTTSSSNSSEASSPSKGSPEISQDASSSSAPSTLALPPAQPNVPSRPILSLSAAIDRHRQIRNRPPSSPFLPLSSGPSNSSPDRDFSSLPEDSPPPTTNPASGVLGPFGMRINEYNNASSPPEDGLASETAATEKLVELRKDSVQRMSVESAAALAQNLANAGVAVDVMGSSPPDLHEDVVRKVRFASEDEYNFIPSVELDDEDEADCPEEWEE